MAQFRRMPLIREPDGNVYDMAGYWKKVVKGDFFLCQITDCVCHHTVTKIEQSDCRRCNIPMVYAIMDLTDAIERTKGAK